MVKWVRAAGALLVLAALLVGVPLVLVLWVGNPYPPGGFAALGLLSDAAVLGVLAVLAWLFWAQLAACVLWEIPAALRGVPAARLPIVTGGQQRLIRALVHSAVAAGVTGAALASGGLPADGSPPAAGTTAVPSSAHGPSLLQTAHPTEPSLASSATDRGPARPPASPGTADADASPTSQVTTVIVTTGDTLWGLAERHLGAGERWREIADLNLGRDMGDGVFSTVETLQAGWSLYLPVDPPKGHAPFATSADPPAVEPTPTAAEGTAPPNRVEVQPGDSLWRLAEDHLEDPNRWVELYQANRALIGDDPDVIIPGQSLRLASPTAGAATGGLDARPSRSDERTPESTDAGKARQGHQQITGSDADSSTGRDGDSSAAPSAASDDASGSEGSSEAAGDTHAAPAAGERGDDRGVTALRAVLASAVCLSGGALAMLLMLRRRQFRERRSGRAIAATPPGLVGVERTIVEAGAETMETTEFIDLALRHLAASQRIAGRELPNLGAAVIGADELSVLFVAPADGGPPEGWDATDDNATWTLPRQTILEPELRTQPAPYPALVSVGLDEDERTWLLDLEAIGVVGVAGPGAVVEDMVRFWVAELALNAWAEGTEVLLTDGFATETTGLNPTRLRVLDDDPARRLGLRVARDAAEAADNLGKELLDLRRDAMVADSTGPVVLIVHGQPGADLVDAAGGRDRSRLIVVHHDTARDVPPVIDLTDGGLAYLPAWGVTLQPSTLPTDEAAAMAELMASLRGVEDQPMPPATQDSPVAQFMSVDGSLRSEFTQPRSATGGTGGSMLPEPDEKYLSAAATTVEDLEALAPDVPPSVRSEIEALDPGLDADVAAWTDPDARRPRVQVLGPVAVEAWGARPEEIANLGGTTEFIVFLACQDHGVTPERAAVALGWSEATVHNRARDARRLLGDRPDGEPWLPDASKTDAARQRGVATYELHPQILVAADLFRRLRARGQARGADGLNDMIEALSLVSGRPFDQLRRRGYGWLAETPLDHYLSHAVVDLAHLIVNRTLADGDTVTARWACQVAITAAPDEDKPRLDLAAVDEADGVGTADETVTDQVIDRVDADPTPRTEQILEQRRWLAS
ncbi:LysM peptidoglycan-binding domain-containing protein [Nocardioides terrigena]|uniref:LysM peptidoglycan-binding domain-containing protein n=1 Tax=Nocardioides terrigena TaxID=424797 RepID=UPI000D30D16F|nr:LysM peptidoglycan-binding domain-containing protein [Nocardioides terrigena]